MRADEQLKELFYWDLEHLEKAWKQKASVTKTGPWVAITFGTLANVKARGYKQALVELADALEQLIP